LAREKEKKVNIQQSNEAAINVTQKRKNAFGFTFFSLFFQRGVFELNKFSFSD
jgi:hypothetical protein